jgi:hypothetical protein
MLNPACSAERRLGAAGLSAILVGGQAQIVRFRLPGLPVVVS